MIDQVTQQCVEGIYLALLASWRALPVFAVVAVLAILLRKRLPARYLCWLWLIVIARLLLPFSVESTVAISSVADQAAQTLMAGQDEGSLDSGGFDTFTYEDENGKSVTVALLPPDATAEQQAVADAYVATITAEEIASRTSAASGQQYHQVNQADSSPETLEPMLELFTYSIALGLPAIGIVLLLRHFVSHVRFAWTLRSCPLVQDRSTVDCLLRVCDELDVGRRPKLKQVSSLHAPAMFGLLRPTVCLPENWREDLTNEQLDWVFRHEVAHVGGRDGLWLSLATLAKSIQWFNPLSWIAVNKLQHSMERAADELATRHMNRTQVREYGELLIRFAAGQTPSHSRPTIGLLAMAAPKGLQQRIESLGEPVQRRGWFRGVIAVLLIGMVGVCGLTDAKPFEKPSLIPRPMPNFEVALAGDAWKRPSDLQQTLTQQDTRVVSINVEKALRKAKELQPGIDAEKFVMAYFASYPVIAEQRAETRIIDGVMTVEVTKQQESLMKQMLSGFEDSGLWQIVTELNVIDADIRLLDQFDWSASESTIRFARLDRAPALYDQEHWAETMLSVDVRGWPSEENENYNIAQTASVPIRVAKISRLQSERFIRQLQLDHRSNIMQSPKITMFNGQRAVISDVVQRPFVTDVLQITGDKATALQPKISVFEDGWKFFVETTATADEEVNLQMVFTHASIDGVKLANLPNSRENAPEERVTIQVPTANSDSIAVESVLNESEALLVFSPKPYANESDTDVANSNLGIGQVFMIRTQLILDVDFLKHFMPVK
ncbi:MAG: M56 family metallopeptidase [Rubripirellula sp.]